MILHGNDLRLIFGLNSSVRVKELLMRHFEFTKAEQATS